MRRHTSTTRMLAGTAVSVAVAVGVAGCGGSSAPSRASYTSQANAICATYNAKLHTLGSQLQAATSQSQAEAALGGAVTTAQEGTDKLKALTEPSGDDSAINKALGAQQQQVTDLQSLLSAVKSQNKTAAQSDLTTLNSSETSVNQAFDAAGLQTCGSGS